MDCRSCPEYNHLCRYCYVLWVALLEATVDIQHGLIKAHQFFFFYFNLSNILSLVVVSHLEIEERGVIACSKHIG